MCVSYVSRIHILSQSKPLTHMDILGVETVLLSCKGDRVFQGSTGKDQSGEGSLIAKLKIVVSNQKKDKILEYILTVCDT